MIRVRVIHFVIDKKFTNFVFMKNSEIISRVANGLRAITKDDHISQRYILNVAEAKARFLMTNQMHFSDLIKITSLHKTISCVKMVPIESKRCGVLEFANCNNLMRSEKKLDKIAEAKYGSLILYGITVSGEIIKPTTLRAYSNRKNRSFAGADNTKVFYMSDGYVYLPDSEIELIDLVVIGFSDKDIKEMSSCDDDIKDKSKSSECESVLDQEFGCPEKLLDLAVREAINEIASTWRQIQPDENPNMDANLRTKTTV